MHIRINIHIHVHIHIESPISGDSACPCDWKGGMTLCRLGPPHAAIMILQLLLLLPLLLLPFFFFFFFLFILLLLLLLLLLILQLTKAGPSIARIDELAGIARRAPHNPARPPEATKTHHTVPRWCLVIQGVSNAYPALHHFAQRFAVHQDLRRLFAASTRFASTAALRKQ